MCVYVYGTSICNILGVRVSMATQCFCLKISALNVENPIY